MHRRYFLKSVSKNIKMLMKKTTEQRETGQNVRQIENLVGLLQLFFAHVDS